jgi:hypothetical protein
MQYLLTGEFIPVKNVFMDKALLNSSSPATVEPEQHQNSVVRRRCHFNNNPIERSQYTCYKCELHKCTLKTAGM